MNTALLAAGVVVAALAVGVPLAWLVVRTDLPGRRWWGLAASLPLVIPSFVAALALLGALAPRGLLQQALEPLGVEARAGAHRLLGRAPRTHALDLPVRLPARCGRAARARPLGGGGRALARLRPRRGLLPRDAARRSGRHSRPARCSSRCTSSRTSARSRSWATTTLTTGIYTRYEALLALDAAAILALVLVGLAIVIVLLATRFGASGTIYRSDARLGTAGGGRPARPLALAGARVLHRRARALPRAAARRARVVVDRGRPDHRPRGRGLGRGAELGVDGRSCGRARRARRAARRPCSRGASRRVPRACSSG